MAEIRLNKILKQYNIGLHDLVVFMRTQGLYLEENPNTKISDEYLPLIHAQYASSELMLHEAERIDKRMSEILSSTAHPETRVSPDIDRPEITPEMRKNLNLKEMRELLMRLRKLISKVSSSTEEEFPALLTEFKEISSQWSGIGPVPEDQVDAMERIYGRYCSEFAQASQRFDEQGPDEDDETYDEEEPETEFDSGETVTLRVTSVSAPFRVITEGFGDFKGGVLFPEHVTCNGEPISAEWSSRYLTQTINVGDELEFTVIENLSSGGYAVLGFEAYTLTEETLGQTNELKVGDTYPVSIVGETISYYLVELKEMPLLGVVLKTSVDIGKDSEHDTDIVLQLAEKQANPMHLLVFVKPAEVEKAEEERDTDELIADFLKPEELDVISEEDLAIVRYMLETYPSITKYNRTQLPCDIYCRVPDNSPMQVYLNGHPGFMEDQSFWLSFSHERETGAEIISLIHADPTIVIEIRVLDDNQFVVSKFDSEGTWETRNIIKYNNRKACLIAPSKYLHFVTRYEAIPAGFSTASVIDLIEKLSDFNTRILKDVQNEIKDKTYLNARDYTTLGSYLKYQRNEERESAREPRFIEPSRLAPGSGDAMGSISLHLNLLPDDYEYLQNEEEDSIDGIHVAIVDEEGKHEFVTGILRSDGVNTYLNFNRGKLNMEQFLSEGIYLRRRVNTKHLDIQIDALDGFVHRDSLGVYQDLINGRLTATDASKYEGLEFINPIFKEAGADNNQPLAVKKALANENILLIQGPPGTGKTTIIVEIVNQLAKEGKKVLVCSQAHAAVTNIYDRLDDKKLDILRLDDRDDMESVAMDFDHDVYSSFLKNNSQIIRMLITGTDKSAVIKFINGLSYAGGDQELNRRYRTMHMHLVTYYSDQGQMDAAKVQQILSNLEEETANITGIMLQAQMYRTKDVIMGTCIGVGMDKALRSRAVDFDTVIIDEAGKANLAETIVPMQLGHRFILVGDHRQLPPFIDRQDILEYVMDMNDTDEDNTLSVEGEDVHEVLDARKVVSSLSNSLFADFYEHVNFPEENKVTLNYQFRMNPEIGDYISQLFYQGVLKSGSGTENQKVYIDGYKDAVTFVDTSTTKYDPENNPNESSARDGSIYNDMEISIICNDILPVIQKTLEVESDLKLGIITPYKAQYFKLKTRLADTDFSGCVHTIDSIQGSEFDIVVFSFVRSFTRKSGKTVGFLDDMRRLNVSLSRAKKMLILVGNLNTLQRPEAHNDYGVEGMVSPVEVFRSIGKNVKKFNNASDFEVFMSSSPAVGTVYRDCACSADEGRVIFELPMAGRALRFSMPMPIDWEESDTIDIVYLGLSDKSGKPKFACADVELFVERHNRGDRLDATVIKVFEKARHKIVLVKADGVVGILHETGLGEQNFTVGETLEVEYRSFKQEKRGIQFAIPRTMAETVTYSTRTVESFIARVTEKFSCPKVRLEFEDNSTLNIDSAFLWHVGREGETYDLVKFNNGNFSLNSSYYYEFIRKHNLEDRLFGEVIGEDEFQFYIEIEGAYAVVTKNYLKGRDLSIGERRKFQVFRFDEKHKTIILGL